MSENREAAADTGVWPLLRRERTWSPWRLGIALATAAAATWCYLIGEYAGYYLNFFQGSLALTAGSMIGMLLVLLAASVGLWWKWSSSGTSNADATVATPQRTFPWNWALWIAIALSLVLFMMDFREASSANPAGEWDAISTWNVRARCPPRRNRRAA